MAFIGVLWLVGARLAAILPVTITMGPGVFYLISLVLCFVSLYIWIIFLNLRYFEWVLGVLNFADILPSFLKMILLNGVDVNT